MNALSTDKSINRVAAGDDFARNETRCNLPGYLSEAPAWVSLRGRRLGRAPQTHGETAGVWPARCRGATSEAEVSAADAVLLPTLLTILPNTEHVYLEAGSESQPPPDAGAVGPRSYQLGRPGATQPAQRREASYTITGYLQRVG